MALNYCDSVHLCFSNWLQKSDSYVPRTCENVQDAFPPNDDDEIYSGLDPLGDFQSQEQLHNSLSFNNLEPDFNQMLWAGSFLKLDDLDSQVSSYAEYGTSDNLCARHGSMDVPIEVGPFPLFFWFFGSSFF